jgi:hypothetical protein
MHMARTCDSETALLQGQLQSPNATGNLLFEYSCFSTNGRFSQKNPLDLTHIRNLGIEYLYPGLKSRDAVSRSFDHES